MLNDSATLPRRSVPLLAWYGVSWANSPHPETEAKSEADKPKVVAVGPAKVDPAEFGRQQKLGEGRGLVLGRFLPPHRGHQFVVDFARNYTEDLTLIVRSQAGDSPSGEERAAWLGEMFPLVKVIVCEEPQTAETAASPSTQRWAELIKKRVGQVDFLFGSEPHGVELARLIGARFTPVDVERKIVPVSGTQIRGAPLKYWEYLPDCVRPFYLRRVCLMGPESTGKTTLARQLAEHYHTVAVPEYGRMLAPAAGADWRPLDVQYIMRAQLAAEAALSQQANRVLFCDTGLLQLSLWSKRAFGAVPPALEALLTGREQSYDLCLLMDADVPFVGDAAHDQPLERAAFLAHCHSQLNLRGQRYMKISGSWPTRFAGAVQEVDAMLAKNQRQA